METSWPHISNDERYKQIFMSLDLKFQEAKYELDFKNAYQLFVAIILAARCTDKLVNKITPVLFEKIPTIQIMAQQQESEVIQLVKDVTYPENKVKHLLSSARIITEKYYGNIPNKSELLEQLPGIGRKSANTILAEAFHIPAIAVDTHITRVSQRIGLTRNSIPERIESDLCKIIPKEKWINTSHQLILLGRYTCTAIAPNCKECPVQSFCKTNCTPISKDNSLF